MDLTHIPISEIPEDGLTLFGELPPSVFELPPGDAQPTTPLSYDLHLMRSGDLILATGRVDVTFTMECVRCLERFPHVISLYPYDAEFDPDGAPTINLTERLREDILLALPAYPHCDDSSDGRKCPVGDKFTRLPASGGEESGEPPAGLPPGAWDVLGNWKPRPSED